MNDSELIDTLERFLQNNGGLLIHNDGYKSGYPGLGVGCTGRTLRQALQQTLEPAPPIHGDPSAQEGKC